MSAPYLFGRGHTLAGGLQTSGMEVSARPGSLWAQLPSLFQLLVAPDILGLWQHRSDPCLHLRPAPSTPPLCLGHFCLLRGQLPLDLGPT